MTRSDQIHRAKNEIFDIAIIGGGITGAGILLNAVERGLKVILIEKKDFASGTSSRSSKMVHGGLRYLQYFQLGLVKEGLRERAHLLKKFPNWVKPIAYVFPHFGSFFGYLFKVLGIWAYQLIAGKDSGVPFGKYLSPEKVLELLPGYQTHGLRGGNLYYDCATNDARLAIGTIIECQGQGAVALNYFEAIGSDTREGRTERVACRDLDTGEAFEIRAKLFINASGAWTDEVLKQVVNVESKRMQPTCGIHVIISSEKLPKDLVSVVRVKQDGRYIYSLPWENGLTILGTTDTDFEGRPTEITSQLSDVQYILNAFNDLFTNLHLELKDILSVYAGLRPLLRDENKSNTSRSRDYEIWWTRRNWINIAGGKLTSFLSMGERCLQVASERFSELKTPKKPFRFQYPIDEIGLSQDEVRFCLDPMAALHLEDVFTRRTSTTYSMRTFDTEKVLKVAQWMASELEKDSLWIKNEIESYKKHWKEYHPDYLTGSYE